MKPRDDAEITHTDDRSIDRGAAGELEMVVVDRNRQEQRSAEPWDDAVTAYAI